MLQLSRILHHGTWGFICGTLGRLASTAHQSSSHIWDTDSFIAREPYHLQLPRPTQGRHFYWNADNIPPKPSHTCVECSQFGIIRRHSGMLHPLLPHGLSGLRPCPLLLLEGSYCSDDFPILVEGSYSDDKVKTLQDRLGAHSQTTRLAEYKMEGFLQRSITIPNWKMSSFSPGMARYRLRYWFNHLPTFAELKRRRERQVTHVPAAF
jgi:hypothetical protein